MPIAVLKLLPISNVGVVVAFVLNEKINARCLRMDEVSFGVGCRL